MYKASLRCVGKYMKGFGDALLECGIFGAKILQQVFSGSHCVRSFARMVIIEDALVRLKWETNKENASTYSSQISHTSTYSSQVSHTSTYSSQVSHTSTYSSQVSHTSTYSSQVSHIIDVRNKLSNKVNK